MKALDPTTRLAAVIGAASRFAAERAAGARLGETALTRTGGESGSDG